MNKERITPLFFKLKSHILKKKDTCGAMTGVCLPSINGHAEYNLKYNIYLNKEFHKSVDEIGATLDINEYAYKFTKFSGYDEIKNDYQKFNNKLKNLKKNSDNYTSILHNKPTEYLQDANEDFNLIKDIIEKNDNIIYNAIEDMESHYKLDKTNKLHVELFFRQSKMHYFRIKNNIHYLIWKWGIWSMPLKWRAWLTWEWRHIEYIMENTFHYYLMAKLEIYEEYDKYKLMLEENNNIIKQLLTEHTSHNHKLSDTDLLYSNEILKLMNQQIEAFNDVKNKWNDLHEIKLQYKEKPSKLFHYSLAGLGVLISCIIFNK